MKESIKTIRELDTEARASFTGIYAELSTSISGIDYSYLSKVALVTPEQCIESDEYWDFDVVFTQVTSGIATATL